ncbi:hypothetical protein [Pseudobutyrivibrio xylanivorans]|uniref:Resolvase n=1 Tax=Pseudobutyrivibrio xylanivorans TaxID=185007 RepID=A0A5P6VNZ3_PSEXY|nr:hypothetical protein [Pseudobutyrivibrio xylanivorans]QFJ53409.1 hypothetical protein FXF36_00235 [Pseudobutyrivibrio xylanivorans]
MFIHQYADSTEDLTTFLEPVGFLQMMESIPKNPLLDGTKSLSAPFSPGIMTTHTIENRRSFRNFEILKNNCGSEDAIAVTSVKALGLNDTDIVNQLDWFISNKKLLIICDMPSTYQYGLSKDVNRAVLATIRQSLVAVNNISLKPSRNNAGRKAIEYPDNWEDLYDQWVSKEISSKEFIEKSGLKKATFYNLLTEYKELLAQQDELDIREA